MQGEAGAGILNTLTPYTSILSKAGLICVPFLDTKENEWRYAFSIRGSKGKITPIGNIHTTSPCFVAKWGDIYPMSEEEFTYYLEEVKLQLLFCSQS